MTKNRINIKKKYLIFPTGKYVTTRNIVFFSDGKVADNIEIKLDYINPTERTFYDVEKYIGKEIVIEISSDIEYIDMQSDVLENTEEISQRFRPMIHFTPIKGWINDPNGLFQYVSPVTGEKTWHMFYQYNPYGLVWGNMHWGSAVSKDLFHWKHRPIALYPDELGAMYSGSAVVDKQNCSGLKSGDEDVILLFYTAAGGENKLSEGKKYSQCIAYSIDGGNSFKKYEKNPVIPPVTSCNRDPKVIWCDELKKYIMALYLEDSKFSLFISSDLLTWDKFQEIEIEGDSECPDFFPLNVNGDQSKRKWILIGASARYVICEYKEFKFNIVQDVRSLNYEKYSYAAQTFANVEDGRRISIAWNRDLFFADASFNGQMSVPMEMSLKENNHEYYLCVKPVSEINTLKINTQEFKNIELNKLSSFSYPTKQCAYDIELDLDSAQNENIVINIFGKSIVIEPLKNSVSIGECKCPIKISDFPSRLRMIIDSCTIEILSGNGEAEMTASMLCDYNCKKMVISSYGKTTINMLSISELAL